MTAGKRFKRLVRERARRTGESYVSARRALLAKRSEERVTTTGPTDDLVEVTVEGVRISPPDGRAWIELHERDGERRFPVFIGHPEATAIAFALQGGEAVRPMTHDALKLAIDALGGRLARIVVAHLPATSTFTADVVIAVGGGDEERHLDWRVSDAVALAVRCDPRPAVLVPRRLLDFPAPPGAASLLVRCSSCGAPVQIAESALQPVPEAPGHALADVDCLSCGAHHTLQVRLPSAGASA